MSDITKCSGVTRSNKKEAALCALRKSCFRYTAPVDERQSWVIAPYQAKKQFCELYMPAQAGAI